VRRELSQAATGGYVQKPCQYEKAIFINALIVSPDYREGRKSHLRRRNPAKNSCSGYLRKYPLTIRA
jgi:hypothetical protein